MNIKYLKQSSFSKMSIKLFDYEILILKEFFRHCFIKKFVSFNKFLNYYTFVQRNINESGEYLSMKRLKNTKEADMSLCDITIEIESQDLQNGAEFIMWVGEDSILLEGYSFENKWLSSNSKIRKLVL